LEQCLPFGIASGERFPRAWLEPRREGHSSGLKTHAFPAGVVTLRSPELVWVSCLDLGQDIKL